VHLYPIFSHVLGPNERFTYYYDTHEHVATYSLTVSSAFELYLVSSDYGFQVADEDENALWQIRGKRS
jgi:hypothetical protein